MGYLLTSGQRKRSFLAIFAQITIFFFHFILFFCIYYYQTNTLKRDLFLNERTENTAQILTIFEVNVEILLS